MFTQSLQAAIESTIGEATGSAFQLARAAPLTGGCIHQAACLHGTDGRRFFVKRNARIHLPAFAAEAFSLSVLADTATVNVPQPVGTCVDDAEAALILEYLPLGSPQRPDWTGLGARLARLHAVLGPHFGWPHDNWLGPSPQANPPGQEWPVFFSRHRLQPQLKRARDQGLNLSGADELFAALPAFYKEYRPVPSLLHGDLWRGNAAFLQDGSPVVFDPASYYGDRETDLALTELFGGFPRDFYAGYDSVWPLDPGYKHRQPLHNLYHVLNHFNLFGGGYGQQAQSLIRSLLQRVRGA